MAKEPSVDCVTYDELSEIIQSAIKQALSEYQHDCIMELKDEDVEHVRDLVGAIKEVGDGSLAKGIVVIRDNHKFIVSLHKAATKVGWGVFIITASVIGALSVVVAGVWRHAGGGQ